MKSVYKFVAVALYLIALVLLVFTPHTWRQMYWKGVDPRINVLENADGADAQLAQILAEAKKAAFIGQWQVGFVYGPEKHLEHIRQITILEKQLEKDWRCPNATDDVYCYEQEEKTGHELAKLRDARAELDNIFDMGTDQSKRFPNVYTRGWKSEYERLRASDPVLREYEGYATSVRHFDIWPYIVYFLMMYPWTMALAVMMYWALALAKGISLRQFLLLVDRTALAIGLWPVMFWRINRLEIKQVARLAMRRLAMLVSGFITLAPALAFGQSKSAHEDKRVDDGHVLVIDPQETAPADPPVKLNVSFSTGVSSQYIAAIGAVPWDAPVVQSDLNFSWDNGWAVDFWTSTSLNGEPNYGKENDYTVTYTSKNWTVGVDYVDLSPQYSLQGGDLIDAFLQAQKPLRRGLAGYLRFDRLDVTTDHRTNSAFNVASGLKYGWKRGRWSGTSEGSLLYDTGTFGFVASWVERARASLSVALNPHWLLTGQVYATAPDRSSLRGAHFSYGTAVTVH